MEEAGLAGRSQADLLMAFPSGCLEAQEPLGKNKQKKRRNWKGPLRRSQCDRAWGAGPTLSEEATEPGPTSPQRT